MISSKVQTDHVRPIASSDVNNKEDLKEGFCWKNNQPSVKQDSQQKGTRFNFVD